VDSEKRDGNILRVASQNETAFDFADELLVRVPHFGTPIAS
jgi:hypothetical protein